MTHKLYNIPLRQTFSKEIDLSELLLRLTNQKRTGLIYWEKLNRLKMTIAEKKRKEEEEESKRKRKKEIDLSNVPFHMLKPKVITKDGRSTRTTKPKSEMTSSSKQKKKQFVDPSVGIKRLKMMNAKEKRKERKRKREERKRKKVKESIVSGIPEENVARTTKQKKPKY